MTKAKLNLSVNRGTKERADKICERFHITKSALFELFVDELTSDECECSDRAKKRLVKKLSIKQ